MTGVPANGFTRTWRRVLAVICAIVLFGLLFGHVMGFLVKEVPTVIWGGLFGGMLMIYDPINDVVKRLTGGKS